MTYDSSSSPLVLSSANTLDECPCITLSIYVNHMFCLIIFLLISLPLSSSFAPKYVIGPKFHSMSFRAYDGFKDERGIWSNSSIIGEDWYRSHISTIKCFNLGGIVRAKLQESDIRNATYSRNETDETISIPFGCSPSFVTVTGESGSGKSLLVSKSLSLILGGKVTASLVPRTPYAMIEVLLKLSEPHLSIARDRFIEEGIDPSLLRICEFDKMATITLKREFTTYRRSKQGLKSTCQINGIVVPLRTLRSIASTFIAVVDASMASTALSSPLKRLKLVDIAVSRKYPDILQRVVQARNKYRESRIQRERIERELENRVLSKSLSFTDPAQHEIQLDLIRHFVDELDVFETRIHSFRDRVKKAFVASFATDDEHDDAVQSSSKKPDILLGQLLSQFVTSSWFDVMSEDSTPVSMIYTKLINIREALKELDSKIAAAEAACDVISSLSSKHSMTLALESARNFLYEADGETVVDVDISRAFEKSHEMLNDLENMLIKCKRFFDDDMQSPLSKLLRLKSSVGVSIEDIDLLLADWGFLSRKHGVSAFLLPSCHRSLRLELDGNVEKSTLLPHAKQTEELNLIQYDDACKQLSKARTEVCENLSKDVSLRLPSLGMEDFLFISRVNSNVRNCSHTVLSSLGVDSIDFLLLNTKMLKDDELPSVWNVNDQYNQHLDVVGSSGEKARVLICLETTVPGSIGACIADLHPRVEIIDNDFAHPMVAILYDEIDAHVGGRALVALGKMLHEQTNYFERFGKRRKRRGQVICITHSASLAALADHHLVVHKVKESRAGLNDMIEVIVENVEGEQRTKELARMASGDIATNEAELLAEALIQNHWKEKNHQ